MRKLGFGAMRLPENGRFSKGIDLDLTCEMIDYFIEKGYNYLILHILTIVVKVKKH